jgi:Ca2+-binding RTX toxin-like protein
LLGKPLDLATLNLVRGRDAGIPSLNTVRAYFYQATANSTNSTIKSLSAGLKPYSNWIQFAQSLRHPESLVNFIAAYGNFNGLVGADTVVLDPNDFGTDAAPIDFSVKRNAAAAIVNCWLEDQTNTAKACVNFMSGPAASTGVNDIDLWIGGLAENNTRLGSMLGSTFDYVFKTQMENLQESDRFYYLNRLAGTNLIAQIETNFWSQIIMRNTDVASLPADAFSVPSRTFDLPANSADNAAFLSANQPGLVFDASGAPMSKWIYTGTDHVTWNGTTGNDWIMAGSGDDSLYGGLGNDYLSGGKGDDFIMGGEGNDVIEDPESSVGNVLIGGPGDDYLSGGKGLNAYNGNDGNDFIVYGDTGGAGLGGLGNDWIRGSAIADAIVGDEGDDWMEGVNGVDGLVGDPVGGLGVVAAGTVAGWDVMLASPAGGGFTGVEGGDIVKGESGGDALLGGNGFDWLTSYNTTETTGTTEDMSNNAVNCGVGNVCALLDQFTDVEGISGGEYDDDLQGTSVTALQVGAVAATPGVPAAVAITNQLVAKDCQLITGLQTLLNSVGVNNCAWTSGDIMIGGAGSDVITGRNGNDLIDGNSFLEVWIKIPDTWGNTSDPKAPTPPAGFAYVNDMAQVQSYILAHNQDEGASPISQMSIYRGIRTAPYVAGENDIAVFQAPQANYTITKLPSGAIQVVDPRNGGAATNDGTDVLVNIETMRFPTVAGGAVYVDVPVGSLPAAAPRVTSVSSIINGLIVTFTNPVIDAGVMLKGFQVRVWRNATRSTLAAPVTPVATQTMTLPTPLAGALTAAQLAPMSVTVSVPAATGYFVDVVAITTNPSAPNPNAEIIGTQPANATAAPVVTGATRLTLTQPAQATGVYSGSLLSTQPIVSITNSANPPVVAVANNTSVVTAALWNAAGTAAAPNGQSITAGATATAVAGVATFTGMIITGTPGATYTIHYSSGGLTVATQSVTLASTPASKLGIRAPQTTSAVTGVALSPQPIVEIQNSSNQVVTTATGSVTADLYNQGTTTPATLASMTGGSATVVNGVATFSGMTITGTPGTYTIGFSSNGFTLTQDITITAVPTATKLAINRSAVGSTDGLALATQPIIWATNDAGLAGFAGFNSPIVATLYDQGTSTPATGASITNGSATATNGVATFSGLTITGTPGTYTIEYSSGVLTVATQLITVASATSTTTLTTTPSAVAGAGIGAFTTQPVITLKTDAGTFTGTDGTVTASIGNGPGTAILSGSNPVTSVGGVATFTNLGVASFTAPGTYTITYTFVTGETTSQTVALSNNVTTGTVTRPAAVGVSGNGTFAIQPRVTLSTNDGLFTGTDGNVVATISSGAILSGATRALSSAGVATFANLGVGTVNVSGNYTITFTFNGSVVATQNITLVSTNPTTTPLTITATPGASAGRIAVNFTGIQGVTSYVVAAYSSATSTQIIRSTTVTVTAGAPSYSAVIANLSPGVATYYIDVIPSGSNQTYTRVVATTP